MPRRARAEAAAKEASESSDDKQRAKAPLHTTSVNCDWIMIIELNYVVIIWYDYNMTDWWWL